MAESPEVTAARAAAQRAMDKWVTTQRQTNDEKQVSAAKAAYMEANAKANALATAKTKPVPGYGR